MTPSEEWQFRFKQLGLHNWFEPEPIVVKAFAQVDPQSGRTRTLNIADWFQRLSTPKIEDSIPAEIHALYEVARTMMFYGCFFYPLFAAGIDYLTRIGDLAVRILCDSLTEEPKNAGRTFKERIDWLASIGWLNETERDSWHALRDMRNLGAHPEMVLQLPPTEALHQLYWVGREINDLFTRGHGA